MIPKIPMTTRKPSASLPRPASWTRVSAVAETMVEPMKARNFRQVARTVRSFISSVSAGRIDASGILTSGICVDKFAAGGNIRDTEGQESGQREWNCTEQEPGTALSPSGFRLVDRKTDQNVCNSIDHAADNKHCRNCRCIQFHDICVKIEQIQRDNLPDQVAGEVTHAISKSLPVQKTFFG